MDFRIAICIVGKSLNLLELWDLSEFGEDPISRFQAEIDKLTGFGPVYICQELAYLYKQDYFNFLQNYLKIPIDCTNPTIVGLGTTGLNG